jgi:hypothetical protein
MDFDVSKSRIEKTPIRKESKMSSVSSVSSDTLAYMLQQLNQQQNTSSANSSKEARRADFEQQFEATAQAAGLDTDALADLKDEIQTSVINAIENYDESDSSMSLDETIQTAIDNVFEENGYDAEEIESRLQAVMDTMREKMSAGGPPPEGAPPMGPPPEMNSTGEETDTSTVTSSTDTTNSSKNMISMLLNSSDSDVDFLKNLTGILFGLDVQA